MEGGGLDIRVKDYVFQTFFQRGAGDYLFVLLSGATKDRSLVRLPYFNRHTWAQDFPGSVLCVSDPTLDLDGTIRLGWYFGTAQNDATEELAELARSIARNLGVPDRRIVFYGSSGGGFAAMMLAARMERALAVAINPQTVLIRYAKEHSLRKFLAVCLGSMSKEEAHEKHLKRLSAIAGWERSNSRCLLVQNILDGHHFRQHFRPFIRRFGIPEGGLSDDGRMGSLLYEDERGHVGEPRQMLPEILDRALSLKT